jgi:tetratricopeptide (TPR) repeat protein
MSIYGLGGGGKTAVALELAYRMMANHSPFLVLWVPAISRETFEIAYREIGILLRIPGITDDNADLKQLIRNSLNSGDFGDWLMVIDNADDPGVLLGSTNDDPRAGRLYDYLPRNDRGSILFTTRGRKAAERLTQSSVLELEDMTKAEAKQLMARRIMRGTLLDDQSATNELLELLTYLPLAIVQAVAFINSNQVSISDYVSLFKRVDTEVEVLSERFEDPSRYRETESTIARTWQISFDQILEQDQLAAGYLSLMACVDCISIPQSLLPVEGTAVQRLKALGTLTGYAFIVERQQDSQQIEGERLFNVHRLVQKATVWWLKEHNAWTAWTETAYGRLKELVPYGGHEGRSKWISYLPHAIHVADLRSTLSETGRASLLERIGECQATLGQYAAAEETHRRVLSLRRKNLGNEDASTLISMNLVGLALDDQGKYEEAEAMHRQTLALKEKVLSKEHPGTLTSMNNLALVLSKLGKYEEAEAIHRQELALCEKILSKEHPDTLVSVNNLALMLSKQGKYKEAEAIHRQTLALKEKVLSKEHPDTLTSMNNLALVLNNAGKYKEAEAMYRQTLALKEKVLSKEHPDTLTSMNNLALVLNNAGKYKEAEAMYRQTLALREKVLSKGHPSTLESVYCLAHLLAEQDLYDDATTLYQRACDGYSVVLGDDHPTARACQRHYLEMLKRKEQKRPIVSSEVSLSE